MGFNNGLVSVVIPVYNVSAYIERCILSVMNQSYNDIECIIVDDATTDDSIAKCEKMIANYRGDIQFAILHHKNNRGLSAARNTGAEVAKGEFLYYLDSDDEISSDCIKKLMAPMVEDNSIEMVEGNHILKKDKNEELFENIPSSILLCGNEEISHHYYFDHQICGCAWNKLFRWSFLENNRLSFKEGVLYEDRLWMFYLMKHLNHAYLCKDVTYYYHIRPKSITTGADGKAVGESNLIMYDEILHNLTPGKESQEMTGNVNGFCKPYCLYLKEVPALEELCRFYRKQAKKYGCWYVYVVLITVSAVRRLVNPIGILKVLHQLRWKWVE